MSLPHLPSLCQIHPLNHPFLCHFPSSFLTIHCSYPSPLQSIYPLLLLLRYLNSFDSMQMFVIIAS